METIVEMFFAVGIFAFLAACVGFFAEAGRTAFCELDEALRYRLATCRAPQAGEAYSEEAA